MSNAVSIDHVINIPIGNIRPNPYQPRKVFDKALLEELADSIREFGVLQPISVRRSGDKFELVAGERRLRASKLAGKRTIPAILMQVSERDSSFLALIENLQRENLSFLEEAEGYRNLMKDYGLTQDEIAAKMGKSQSNIANKVRILRLPEDVKEKVKIYGLTERHARALLKIEDAYLQRQVVDRIILEGLNVKNTDELVAGIIQGRGLKPKRQPKARAKKKSSNVRFVIRDIRIYVNTIKKAVSLINDTGGNADFELLEAENGIDMLIHIRK